MVGVPGRILSGVIPSLIHQTLSFESPQKPLFAKGTPLSVSIKRGSPKVVKTFEYASFTLSVRGSRRDAASGMYWVNESLIVSGSKRFLSWVVHQPLKSELQI